MQFYNQEYFAVFWILPPVLIISFWYTLRAKRARLKKLGDIHTVSRMSDFSAKEWRFKAFTLVLAIFFLLFSLLRPQWGEEKKKITRKGLDVVFLLDTSLSMLAADVKPSRIEKAKVEIKSFVKKLKGDRVGLIPFAGSSFLQSPLTLDYSAFFLFLDAISVGYIPDPGSSLADALANAIKAFPKGEKKYRVVIVFSDGEFHGEDLSGVLKQVAQQGIRIYAVGVGTKEGEPIPLRAGKGKVVGYKKDNAGQVVVTKLNEQVLTEVASHTGGLYFPSTAAEQEIDLIYKDMQTLGKKEFKEKLMTEREEHYQLFLLIGLMLVVFSALIGETRKPSETERAGL